MDKNRENKCRTLTADEIELRVGQMSKDRTRATLLLYKNARVDMALLDERFGPENWECDYKELKGNLYCGVGVNYGDGNFVWKWDCGVESKTEAEKGEASDAFKRACVKHGQGRELYTAPTIWVRVPEGGIFRDTYTVTEIGYNDKREIDTLVIIDKTGAEVFRKGGRKPATRPSTAPAVNTATASGKPAAGPEKAPIRKGDILTREMLDAGRLDSIVQKLARFKDSKDFGKNATLINDYYKWDTYETFNEIVRRAKS